MSLIVGEVVCDSTIHAFCRLFIFILYAVDASVEMCFDFIDPVESVWFQQKNKQKSRHNIADCTQYLYINMCMIHASFENSYCLFSLLNKLTTCYKFFITF